MFALRDVSDERALEQARSDLIATASHELRTPVTAVYGAARTLLREDIELSEQERLTFLQVIESEPQRPRALHGQSSSHFSGGGVRLFATNSVFHRSKP